MFSLGLVDMEGFMPEIQKPFCLAMVLCEAAHRCPATGKWTILGTFARLQSKIFPIKCQFVVYFVLTDGNGDIPVGFRVVPADHEFSGESQHDNTEEPEPTIIHFSDPLLSIEGVIGIRLELSQHGVYHCELYSGDEVLMARRLIVVGPDEEHDND
jgi:hypothetical protein